MPGILAFVRPAAGQEHDSPFFLAKLPLQDLPCRLVHDEPVGGYPAGHDGLSQPPVGFEHGLVRIAGDGMDRKADAGSLARDLLLHHDRDAGLRGCKAAFALVGDDAGIEAGGERGVERRFQPIRGDPQDRLVAAGEGRTSQVFLR